MKATASNLLVKPDFSHPSYITITPESARWEHLHFAAIKLKKGQSWSFDTTDFELALTILGGKCDVTSSAGNWESIGSREDVFHGMPTALYLPRKTTLTVKAVSESLDFACGWAKTDKDFPAVLVRPEDVTGGGGSIYALRQLEFLSTA